MPNLALIVRRVPAPATALVACALLSVTGFAQPPARGIPWSIHIIDRSSQGADGVRMADVNGDSRVDITTGWEEGGITRVYLHPGRQDVRQPWPAVTVGKTPNVEDAVFVDLDADGRIDVVSSCEGRTRTMFVHWAPGNPRDYLDPNAWHTEPIPASQDRTMWMFCLPIQVDGRAGVDLVAGSKGEDGQIGWFESPDDPRELSRWKWHRITTAGWIMSLWPIDMDRDGDLDIVTTDRKGPLRGCRWLECPKAPSKRIGPWRSRAIGGEDHEVMFMTVADLDADGADELLCATRDNGLLVFHCRSGERWETVSIPMPDHTGTGKGVAVGDIDRDGQPDLVFSCESAIDGKSGVMWLSSGGNPFGSVWQPHEISGPAGIKFDRIELVDLDGDGDLDVLTCEERESVAGLARGLGVFWYENPRRSRRTR